jgi:hypothetical protein
LTEVSYTNGVNFGAGFAEITYQVGVPPSLPSGTLDASFTAGASGTFAIDAGGDPSPNVALSTGSLPSGLAISTANGEGTISGTPSANTGGTYVLTVSATSSIGSASALLYLTVNQDPTITSASSDHVAQAETTTWTISSTGYPAPTISESGGLPSGVSFQAESDGTATLSGTPTSAGSYPLKFTAANGVGAAATQSFSLVVNAASGASSVTTTTTNPGRGGSVVGSHPTGTVHATRHVVGYLYTATLHLGASVLRFRCLAGAASVAPGRDRAGALTSLGIDLRCEGKRGDVHLAGVAVRTRRPGNRHGWSGIYSMTDARAGLAFSLAPVAISVHGSSIEATAATTNNGVIAAVLRFTLAERIRVNRT